MTASMWLRPSATSRHTRRESSTSATQNASSRADSRPALTLGRPRDGDDGRQAVAQSQQEEQLSLVVDIRHQAKVVTSVPPGSRAFSSSSSPDPAEDDRSDLT
eukprot:5769992-Prymnesium_polylepis.1